MTTIADIAKAAGVSKTTVSRVLNGSRGHVAAETMERVQAVIKRLDYSPNALAKGLKSMRTNVIGIVLSDLQNPFWSAVLDGIERACRSLGYSIMICNACKDPELEEQHLRGLRYNRVDGIIINPTARNGSLLAAFVKEGFPVLALNRKMANLRVETVSVDNVRGAFLATEHLIRLGRKRIALIVYAPGGASTRLERIEGYVLALNRYGLEVDDSLIHIVEDRKDVAKAATMRILQSADRPDAIFSTNNLMSLEILEALRESGVDVPRQLSFVGYDETAWSRLVEPPLTVVKQPAYEMGEIAARNVIRHIKHADKAADDFRVHSMEPVLIVRGSCGADPTF